MCFCSCLRQSHAILGVSAFQLAETADLDAPLLPREGDCTARLKLGRLVRLCEETRHRGGVERTSAMLYRGQEHWQLSSLSRGLRLQILLLCLGERSRILIICWFSVELSRLPQQPSQSVRFFLVGPEPFVSWLCLLHCPPEHFLLGPFRSLL